MNNSKKMDNGIVNIHGKEYLTVAKRVSDFREKYKIDDGWSIISDIIKIDGNVCIIKASIINDKGIVIATGYAEEARTQRGVNSTSALENAETSAIGRALAAAGFGGTEYASANEVSAAISQQNKGILTKGPENTQVKYLIDNFTKKINASETMDELKSIWDEVKLCDSNIISSLNSIKNSAKNRIAKEVVNE